MNQFIKGTFEDLKRAESDYRDAVRSALHDYRKTMENATEESKQYRSH